MLTKEENYNMKLFNEHLESLGVPSKVYFNRGVEEEYIKAAEDTLGLRFCEDFRQFMRSRGAMNWIMYFEDVIIEREITGLNLSFIGEYDVIGTTKKTRNKINGFLNEYVVIEEFCNGVAVQNAKGEIYFIRDDGKTVYLANGFEQFLCIKPDELEEHIQLSKVDI